MLPTKKRYSKSQPLMELKVVKCVIMENVGLRPGLGQGLGVRQVQGQRLGLGLALKFEPGLGLFNKNVFF